MAATIKEPKLAKYAERLIALDEPRVYFLSIPKCGCTYVKNVLWYLMRGEFHANPVRVHDDDSAFLRASALTLDLRTIQSETRAFTVLRNPADRFLSLYLDKIVGPGRKNFVPLADTLSRRGHFIDVPVSLDDHHRNLELLLEWIEENLDTRVDLPTNAHWTPQSYRLEVVRTFDLRVLLVDRLSEGLQALFSEIHGAQEAIALAERNRSPRSMAKSDYLRADLRRRINAIYSLDKDLYRRTSEYWRQNVGSGASAVDVPRLSDIMR